MGLRGKGMELAVKNAKKSYHLTETINLKNYVKNVHVLNLMVKLLICVLILTITKITLNCCYNLKHNHFFTMKNSLSRKGTWLFCRIHFCMTLA